VLPGTRLSATASAFGIVYERESPYTVVSSPTFSAADMRAASELAEAASFFYDKGKAVPWFALMLDALGASASKFLITFSKWFSDTCSAAYSGVSETAIPRVQIDFLSFLFSEAGKTQYFSVAEDIVTWFAVTGEALRCGDEECGGEALSIGIRSGGELRTYTVNPTVRMARFKHSIADLVGYLESGITELEELRLCVAEEECLALVFVAEGEIGTLRVTANVFKFFESLKTDAGSDRRTARFVLPDGDSDEFLSSAEETGVLYSSE